MNAENNVQVYWSHERWSKRWRAFRVVLYDRCRECICRIVYPVGNESGGFHMSNVEASETQQMLQFQDKVGRDV